MGHVYMKVAVYRFIYADRATRGMLLSEDYATESAIVQIRGEPVYQLRLDVDDSQVSPSGFLVRPRPDLSETRRS